MPWSDSISVTSDWLRVYTGDYNYYTDINVVNFTCYGGYFYADGNNCEACSKGTYTPTFGDETSCLACPVITYQSETASTVCVACPENSYSPVGSTHSTNCSCNIGYEPDNGSCQACEAGSFKAVNGSSECALCGAGTYLNESAGTQCLTCPANSDSSLGSKYCICDIGNEGLDGQNCTACAMGKYKDVNGSGTCSACGSGTYLNVTGGSACVSCPSETSSPLE
eukprot:2333589-Rhodomonas_salina.1